MSYNLTPTIKTRLKLQPINTLQSFDKLLIEVYPGIDRKILIDKLKCLMPNHQIIEFDKQYINMHNIKKVIDKLGDDRIFAKMNEYHITNFYDNNINHVAYQKLMRENKIIMIGVGVSILDVNIKKIHISLPRWDIQTNYRNGLANFMQTNENDENTKKFKFGYFFDWRLADKIKTKYFKQYDYFIDFSNDQLSLITSETYNQMLDTIINTPFRLTPFFDPGVWGGKWMQQKFGLKDNGLNYAWSFDGVPEENSVHLELANGEFNLPAIDLVLFRTNQLLGKRVYQKYGSEFPIRFDMLDTIDGQNLSLQVHPTTKYIKQQFNMNYTQEESYYILDTNGDDCYVYIGLKTGVSKEQFFEALNYAYKHNIEFVAEHYVNKIKCKKGDHFLIPAGTIHSSGSDVMVLEISQTPYIFTFKLWDWMRVDLNGMPRAINTSHGVKVLNDKYDTKFVKDNLYNNFKQVENGIINSGLYKTQDIVTNIITASNLTFDLDEKFHMINLVEGQSATINSSANKFAPFVINEYETVIIPANIKQYTVELNEPGGGKYVQAFIR